MSDGLPVCIVNPTAAGGRTGKDWPQWQEALQSALGQVEFFFTRFSGEGREIAQQATEACAKRIFVVGGDGTLNEVVHGVLKASKRSPELALGLWPAGTGSDLARGLNLPSRAQDILEVFSHGQARLLDVGQVDYLEDERDTEYFLNVAGFGLEGMVDRKVPYWKQWAPGKVAYTLAAFTEGVRFGTVDVRLVVGDTREEFQLPLLNAAVANGRYFGGGMCIAPEARMDDGRFDVVLLEGAPFWRAPGILKSLYQGRILENKRARAFPTNVLEAHPCDESPIFVGLDGEPRGRLPARFANLPQAIRMLTPARGHLPES